MAEEQTKIVDAAVVPEVKEDAAPVLTEETPAADDTAAATAAPEDKPAEEAQPETNEETEAAKEEVKPIEEGHLGHKAHGAGFPKNFISTKTFFSFGTEPFTVEALATYKKAEKHLETALHNIAWATHSGQGLLLVGDKKAPSSIINLSDATEPELDGAKGFYITAKGNKHSFKAATVAERDGWVATLKEKVAEAKELVATVTESDIYKQTLESFKPATPAKEDKPEEAAEEAPKAEEPSEEAPKEEDAAARDELKTEDKRRSASRKRASFFGFGKKEDKEDSKHEEGVAAEPPVIETVDEAEAPATEEIPANEVVIEAQPAEEALPDSPKEKVNKRNSFFGGVFSKKEKKVVEASKTEESPKEEAETTDFAPVIPPVEATTPLAVDVASPVAAPAETVESPVVSSEPKKDVKEKRKSSLPFAFGKREKSPAPPAEGEEKSKSAFSKLRATIKGKGVAKTEEKPAEEAAKTDEAPKEGETEAVTDEAAADAPAAEEAPKTEEVDNSKEETPATPVVTAAA